MVVTLPSFGEERAITDTLRLADLRVPVVVQATPDEPAKMSPSGGNSFCGKISACNNLKQYGIPYSIMTLHAESPAFPGICARSAMVSSRMPHRQWIT